MMQKLPVAWVTWVYTVHTQIPHAPSSCGIEETKIGERHLGTATWVFVGGGSSCREGGGGGGGGG